MSPQESAASVRRPPRIEVTFSKEGGGTSGTSDSEVR